MTEEQYDNLKENYLKHIKQYIQISKDLSLISLPERDKINIYNLPKLIEQNILKYEGDININLSYDPNTRDIKSR